MKRLIVYGLGVSGILGEALFFEGSVKPLQVSVQVRTLRRQCFEN
jgi:hypothetical protein